MSFDGVVVRALVHEQQMLVDGRINKIHQPTEHDIVMQIRAQGRNHKLLISANPSYPRMHLTQEVFTNPTEAPMFCMLLRKHCENGIIESIEQIGMERIIHMRIRQRDEIGDLNSKTIIIELMGRHSNIIVLDPTSGSILDGIHHLTPALSSYRIVMPGTAYVNPPEQDKQDILLLSKEQINETISDWPAFQPDRISHSDDVLERRIMSQYSGIGPLSAREIVYRASQFSSLTDSIRDFAMRLQEHRYDPCIVETTNGKTLFAALQLTHVQGERQSFPSISACLQAYYGEKAQRDLVKQRTADLTRFLHNEMNKNAKKLEKLFETIEEAKDADKFRKLGELLTASMHEITRGMHAIELIDYYEDEQPLVQISLDPQLTPSDNAQRYFKRYTKLKNSLAVVQEQINATKEEMSYMDILLHQLANASLTDIEEIRDELAAQGYVRNRNRTNGKRKRTDHKPSVLSFQSSEGITIYVGKNNTQNDYITNRLAHPTDTWLHTKDIPGSHVVIRSRDYSDDTLLAAGQLAAYYSQARTSSQVPVDYTLVKHVRKPNGAKPGFVIYEQQKTMYITPDEHFITQLTRG